MLGDLREFLFLQPRASSFNSLLTTGYDLSELYNFGDMIWLSPLECLCRSFILPEIFKPCLFFYLLFNFRNLLYLFQHSSQQTVSNKVPPLVLQQRRSSKQTSTAQVIDRYHCHKTTNPGSPAFSKSISSGTALSRPHNSHFLVSLLTDDLLFDRRIDFSQRNVAIFLCQIKPHKIAAIDHCTH